MKHKEQGRLVRRDAVKTVGKTGTFRKQTFYIEQVNTYRDGYGNEKEKLNLIPFEANGLLLDKLATIKDGTDVVVSFEPDGREWTNPQTGEKRVFLNLRAFAVELRADAIVPSVPEPAPQTVAAAAQSSDAEEEYLPF